MRVSSAFLIALILGRALSMGQMRRNLGAKTPTNKTAKKAPVSSSSTKETSVDTKTTKSRTASPSETPSMAPIPFVMSHLTTPGTCLDNAGGGGISCGDDITTVFANCFSASDFGVSTPFTLQSFRFWLGGNTVPSQLSMMVWSDSDTSAPPTVPLASATVTQPITGYATRQENVFDFDTPVSSNKNEICIGLYSPTGLHISHDSTTANIALNSFFDCPVKENYKTNVVQTTYCFEALGYY